ncbi:DUF58 domain-containing protein [Cryobacterium arcticum]|uniref:DUF58 domain-containing protein n=1 Tax=Cryobacterium arcticum TaxID=670052 RepID=A0A1B1BGS0_9MICO|nr:DUF58 domain-containing protein [Cryobacterium arcticum]ANP71815.1 hypothetical protein PA27867_0848 [Cryobacterium arcticum]
MRSNLRMLRAVTPLGWAVSCCALAALAAGYTLGWAELVTIGWAAAVLVAVAVAYLFGGTSHRISLSLPVDRVVAGERVPGQVDVQNPTGRRLGAVTVQVPVGAGGVAEFPVPSLAAHAVLDEVFVVPAEHRGIVPIGPVHTVRGDPVGLVRRETVLAQRIDLYVHPRTIAIPSMSQGFVRDLEGTPTRDLTSSDIAFHALREYQPGDDRRSIHWKSTARTGRFMVRQYEQTRRSHLLVVFSLAPADYAGDEEFELAVSVAGSLGVRAIRDARTVSVLVSSGPLATVTPARLLDGLSGVDLTPSAAGLRTLARQAARSVAGLSVVFLVCGSSTPLAVLRAAAAGFPLGVEVVAVVCDPGARPGLVHSGNLSLVTIGFLDDLKQSLARGAAA